MSTKDLLTGVNIYTSNYGFGYDISAGHDVLYLYGKDKPMRDDDVNKMISAGWHQEYEGRNYSEDFAAKDYRHEEAWVFYV